MKKTSCLAIPEKDYLTIEHRKILNWHRMIIQVNNVSLWLVDLAGLLPKLTKYRLLNISDYDKYFSRHTYELIYLVKQIEIVDINEQTLNLYGFSDKSLFLSSLPERHTVDQVEFLKNLIITLLEGRHYLETEATARHSNGNNFRVSIKLIIPEHVERNTKVIISVVSLFDYEPVDSKIASSQNIYQTFVNNASVCIHEIDDEKRLQSMNQAGLKMLNTDNVNKIKGLYYVDIVAEKDRSRINHLMLKAFDGYSAEFEFELLTDEGLRVFSSCFIPMIKSGKRITRIIGVTQDITEQKADAEQLYHLANYDYLTDLPNRINFLGSVKQALAQAIRHQHGLALLFIDLDNFKAINDNFGHETGDALLQEVSHQIKQSLRKEDIVCRFGGDEFIVLLPVLGQRNKAAVIARKILASFKEIVEITGHRVTIGASIGIASYPEDGKDDKSLISHADDAMYNVKNLGGNNYLFHSGRENR